MRRPTADAAAEALAALAAAFEEASVRWLLFGAQAVSVWGEPRATADIDVTAEVPPAGTAALLGALAEHGLAPRIDLDDDFVRRARVLPLVFAPTGQPVDVVLAGSGFERECLDRAIPVDVGGVLVPVMTPEDILIAKTLAGRPKDAGDIRGILKQQKGLDIERIESVLALLESALSRSDLVSEFRKLRQDAGLPG